MSDLEPGYPTQFCSKCGTGTVISGVCLYCGDRSTINDEELPDDDDE